MPDDATLLRRYSRERAEDAFAELVRRHLDAVYSAALRRVGGDAHLAEDVAQQVFVALARNAAALAQREILVGWLYTTTRHLAANVVRGERRRKAREQQACAMNETASESAPAADWSRIGPLLDGAIDQLGEADRTAILLRFVERRAFGEIGTTLRVSEDAARMRVERALDKLRALLERRGIASSSAALGVVLANHAVAAAPAGLAATVTTTASAATSTLASAALNALEIMSTAKSISLSVAVVTLIVALGTAIYETRLRRGAEVALTAAQQNHAAQLARLRETEQRTRLAEADVARLQKAVDDARAAQAAAKARAAAEAEAAKKDAAWDGVAEGKAFLARHPEVKQAYVDFADAKTKARYAAFFDAAHLPAEKVAAFLALQREWSVNGLPYGPGGKMLLLSVGTGMSMDEIGKRMQALLGEDYPALAKFSQTTAFARDIVAQIAGGLTFSQTPLTAEQAGALTAAIGSSRFKPPGEKKIVVDWEAVMTKAQPLLSPPQFAALARARAQDAAQRAAAR